MSVFFQKLIANFFKSLTAGDIGHKTFYLRILTVFLSDAFLYALHSLGNYIQEYGYTAALNYGLGVFHSDKSASAGDYANLSGYLKSVSVNFFHFFPSVIYFRKR